MTKTNKQPTESVIESSTLLAELHDLAAEWRKRARKLDEMTLKTEGGSDSEKRWMTKAGMFRSCTSDLKQVLKANDGCQPEKA